MSSIGQKFIFVLSESFLPFSIKSIRRSSYLSDSPVSCDGQTIPKAEKKLLKQIERSQQYKESSPVTKTSWYARRSTSKVSVPGKEDCRDDSTAYDGVHAMVVYFRHTKPVTRLFPRRSITTNKILRAALLLHVSRF